jgi:hypothetical protein
MAAVGLPTRDTGGEVLVGVRDAPVVLFLELVLFGVGSRRCQKASMNWSRSSSFESCIKADFSSSVMIQRTSSSNHFR